MDKFEVSGICMDCRADSLCLFLLQLVVCVCKYLKARDLSLVAPLDIDSVLNGVLVFKFQARHHRYVYCTNIA
jgi:hypothetical protein